MGQAARIKKARSTAAPAAPKQPKEKKLSIKPATAKNLLALNAEIKAKQAELNVLENRMHDHLRSIFTEKGIENAQATNVSDKAPFTLTYIPSP